MKLTQPSPAVHRRNSQRGSILIVCMVLAGLGTLGAAAFFSLMDAKMMETEQRNTASERRTRRANSLALAREVVLRKYLAAETGPSSAETHTLPGGWGECTIEPFSGAPMGSTGATRTHKTGAIPHKAYSFDIDVRIDDGDIKLGRQFQIKSYPPNLGGDLLYMGQPTINSGAVNTLSGDVNVKGRARFWTGGVKHKVTIKADQYVGVDPKDPKLALNDSADKPVLAQNFPFPNMTAGRFGGSSTPSREGRSSVIDNPDMPHNSYVHRFASLGSSIVVDGGVVAAASQAGDYSAGISVPGGPYPAQVDSVICQAVEGYRLLNAAAYAALSAGGPIYFSYSHVAVGTPPFSNWWTDQKTFDGLNPSGVSADLAVSLQRIQSDLSNAMVDLGGPDPYSGGWWPASFPPLSDSFWTNNNPYLGGVGPAMVQSDGKGTVRISLGNPTLPNVRVVGNIKKLILSGQGNAVDLAAAAVLPPVLIVVTARDVGSGCGVSYKLEEIELQESNKRRHILAVRQENDNGGGSVTVTGTSAFPTWRAIWNFENFPVAMEAAAVSGITVTGGAWTDRSFETTAGTLTIEREKDPGDLEWMGARVAWLEVYQN